MKDNDNEIVEMSIDNSGKIEAFTREEKKKLLIEHWNLLEPFLLLDGVPNDTWLRKDKAFYITETSEGKYEIGTTIDIHSILKNIDFDKLKFDDFEDACIALINLPQVETHYDTWMGFKPPITINRVMEVDLRDRETFKDYLDYMEAIETYPFSNEFKTVWKSKILHLREHKKIQLINLLIDRYRVDRKRYKGVIDGLRNADILEYAPINKFY